MEPAECLFFACASNILLVLTTDAGNKKMILYVPPNKRAIFKYVF